MSNTLTEEPDHAGLLRPFLASRFRSRHPDVPSGSRHRTELLNRLAHRFADVLDWRYACAASPVAVPELARELRSLGAHCHCYCLCCQQDLDGRDVPLAEALGALSGRGLPFLLVCRPAVLAYFEPEYESGPGQRFLLRRPVV